MSENKKYIDRDAALFELRTGFFPQSVEFTEAVSIAKDIIERAPGVDAVEVVRCGDCKHSVRYECKSDACYKFTICRRRDSYSEGVEEDDFCSYGERRETNERE